MGLTLWFLFTDGFQCKRDCVICRRYEDKHKFNYLSGDIIEEKTRQSSFLLKQDTGSAIRLRCITLLQTFSISRFDELRGWCISDLLMTVYPKSLPHKQLQDIVILSLHQADHKTRKVIQMTE